MQYAQATFYVLTEYAAITICNAIYFGSGSGSMQNYLQVGSVTSLDMTAFAVNIIQYF